MTELLVKDVEGETVVHDFSDSTLRVTQCTRKVFGENEQFEFLAQTAITGSTPVRITISQELMMDMHGCLVSIGNIDDVTEIMVKLDSTVPDLDRALRVATR